MSGFPGEYDRSPDTVTLLMLIPDHRVPMVLRRRCLYSGKPSPQRLTKRGQCGLAGRRGVRRESKHRRKGMVHHCLLRERLLGGILMLMILPGERALAGLSPERLPTKPPPARLQCLVGGGGECKARAGCSSNGGCRQVVRH